MFIDINSIKIKISTQDDSKFISLGNYNNANVNNGEKPVAIITEAKYQYNKLWSKDSGRNLAGKQSGTLIGIFPKITIQFKKLTKGQLEAIIPILDAPKQTVSYYDPKKKDYRRMTTYTGDYEITNKNMVGTFTKNGISFVRKNEGFQVSFISIDKRSI